MLTNWIKKLAVFALTGTTFTLAFVPTANADTTTSSTTTSASTTGSPLGMAPCNSAVSCLQLIAINVNNLPQYMQALVAYATNVTAADTSTPTTSLEPLLGTFGSNLLSSNQAQTALTSSNKNSLSLQQQILVDFFNLFPTSDKNTPTTPPPSDLSMAYQTAIGISAPPPPSGTPYAPQDSTYNYVKYASGINLMHVTPDPTATGKPTAKTIYQNYYNSASAVQTYDAFVLSKISADNQNNLLQPQKDLLTQLTDTKNWFPAINAEPISAVLRQILLINSQMYVLLYEMLENQKQQLAVAAMNNTLLIAVNQTNEQVMQKQAQGLMNSP